MRNNSHLWTKIQEENLCAEKNNLIDCLKGIEYDVANDNISGIQDRLYRAFSIFDSYRILVMQKAGQVIACKKDVDPRVAGLVDSVRDKIIWEQVYGANNERLFCTYSKIELKKGIIMSARNIWLEVFLEDYQTVEKKLQAILQNVHRWRDICPERARPILTYFEWFENNCREIALSALGNNDARIKALIDSL